VVLAASSSVTTRKKWTARLQRTFEVHEVADQATLAVALKRLHPPVALVHQKLLGREYDESLRKLLDHSRSTKILLLSDRPSESDGLLALKSGVKGYCGIVIKPLLLKKAVEKVHSGELWINRKLMARLIEEFARLSERPSKRDSFTRQNSILSSLTRREAEVALLVADGARNKEISSRLAISEKTVKAHLTTIFGKLGVSDRLSLALLLVLNDSAAEST
jgi:two-component system NarL family response regulator